MTSRRSIASKTIVYVGAHDDFQLPIDLCPNPSAEFDIHQAG